MWRVIPPRHWFPPVGTGEASAYPPVRGFFLGRRLRAGAPQAHSWRIAVLIYSYECSNFGAAVITVLNVPALNTNAYIWIPVVVVASLILAAPIAWLIAPRLQARYDRWRTQ
jgi:hypothetical protein